MPQLQKEYIESGIVRFVFRDLPVEPHRSALLAAVAGRCAGQQDRFWSMHDLLFATHGEEWGGAPKRDQAVMLEFAARLGLDTDAFKQCMADADVRQAAVEETNQALELGINATPAFLINDHLMVGARPYEVFRRIIEEALQEQ